MSTPTRSKIGVPFIALTEARLRQDWQRKRITAAAYVQYILELLRPPGKPLIIPKVAEFCKTWQLGESTFYKAIHQLKQDGELGWKATEGIMLWRTNPDKVVSFPNFQPTPQAESPIGELLFPIGDSVSPQRDEEPPELLPAASFGDSLDRFSDPILINLKKESNQKSFSTEQPGKTQTIPCFATPDAPFSPIVPETADPPDVELEHPEEALSLRCKAVGADLDSLRADAELFEFIQAEVARYRNPVPDDPLLVAISIWRDPAKRELKREQWQAQRSKQQTEAQLAARSRWFTLARQLRLAVATTEEFVHLEEGAVSWRDIWRILPFDRLKQLLRSQVSDWLRVLQDLWQLEAARPTVREIVESFWSSKLVCTPDGVQYRA